MFININSLKVKKYGDSDSSYVNLANYIVEAKYGYNKIWSKDSGRNLAGVMTGSLKGVFPKIIVTFKKLTKSQLETIAPILDSPKQVVSYYDPKKRSQITMTTYTGDYEVTNKRIIDNTRKNEGFSVSFIAIKKRS